MYLHVTDSQLSPCHYMQSCTEKLLSTPTDINSFIQYLSDVDEVSSAIPEMENRLLFITNLHNVAQQFDVVVTKEEIALYKALFPQFRHLKVAE